MKDRFSLEWALAGLQTGAAGALVLLAWLSLAMLLVHRSVWWFPNLMGTTFGGDPALQQAFGKYTIAGLALHFAQYILLGMLFALMTAILGLGGGTRLRLAGVMTAVAWYYFMYGLTWKSVNPLILLYSPDRAILVGHVLYGFMLGRLPRYLSRYAVLSQSER